LVIYYANNCTNTSPRPPFIRQQRENIGWKIKPKQEAKTIDTLNPIVMVSTEGSS